jgi:hypothetical protein
MGFLAAPIDRQRGGAGLLTEEVTAYFICGVGDHCVDDGGILPPQKFALTIHPTPDDPCTVRAPTCRV